MHQKPAIMFQATCSNAGKSLIVAGLCRAFNKRGLHVRPFKPQNMSNNAAVTKDGGEIGRAQALQAAACKAEPTIDMNPVLLKPEGDTGSQLIVQGKAQRLIKAKDYGAQKPTLLPKLIKSYQRLEEEADLIIIEGAGSASEVNLRKNDIANMGFAEALDLPVVVIGDIEQGGVIANLVGTQKVIDPRDNKRIKGFMINRFRGDPSLFTPALHTIYEHTGWRSLGVVPWFNRAYQLPGEDSQDIKSKLNQAKVKPKAQLKIAVPHCPRIANFDDLDPLRLHPSIDLTLVTQGTPLPLECDLIILPGSKATMSDLAFMRAQGWDIDLKAFARKGGRILGLCGGYQMLGQNIHDPLGIEGAKGSIEGLGLLNVETILHVHKQVTQTRATYQQAAQDPIEFDAYEIHMGETQGTDCERSCFWVGDKKEGAMSPDGHVIGTYLHGLFAQPTFTNSLLSHVTAGQLHGGAIDYFGQIDAALNELADHLEQHLDLDLIAEIAGLSP